jgi:DNA polymerase-1
MAINTPIQGSAADLMKVAMNRLHDELCKGGFKAKIISQVHDELLLEVPEAEVEAMKVLVRQQMESVGKAPDFPRIEVPLTVDLNVGANWLAL